MSSKAEDCTLGGPSATTGVITRENAGSESGSGLGWHAPMIGHRGPIHY